MDGGKKVIGLWRIRESEDADLAPESEPAFEAESVIDTDWATHIDEDAPKPPVWRHRLASFALVLAAIGWTALQAYLHFIGPAAKPISLTSMVSFIGDISAPLALIGVLWLLAVRSSRTEARRFRQTAESMDLERQKLEAALARINMHLTDSRERLTEQSMHLMELGDTATGRINAMSTAVHGEVETIERQAELLKITASAARSDVAVLLASLPKAQVQARQMVTALQEAAMSVQDRTEMLDTQLSLLIARGREADEIAGGAAKNLASQLKEVEAAGLAAENRMTLASTLMTSSIDDALERTAQALNFAREGMDVQSAAMVAMVEQSQVSSARAGAEATELLQSKLALIAERTEAVSAALAKQNEEAAGFKTRLDFDIDALASRLETLENTGETRVGNLAAMLGALRDNADSLGLVLDRGGESAKLFIDRSEGLLTALDAVARELDETLPAAYDRLAGQAQDTLSLIEKTAPQIAQTSRDADATTARLKEAHQSVSEQRVALADLTQTAETRLKDNLAAVEELSKAVTGIETQVSSMSAGAGPQLVEALLRVRDTASQAADHARATLSDVIPQSAAALGEQSKQALSAALTEQVEAQMADIARITEQAVSSAQQATDRLMRQMLTISETSAALEARIAEAKQEVEASDQASFSRRVALLIESLNSTAIDVTKVLSNEVTDNAWAAYLRGDRGIFARRAVRLIDATEVKEILRHYDEEPEFREHVNRYIHDFEAMLRNVLATRDGSPLGVTLLSSDNGKLYVALAQAIERLRN
jgi:hypothetical protein